LRIFLGLNLYETYMGAYTTCMGAHTASMPVLCVIVFFFSLEGACWLYLSIFLGF